MVPEAVDLDSSLSIQKEHDMARSLTVSAQVAERKLDGLLHNEQECRACFALHCETASRAYLIAYQILVGF